MRHWEVNVFRRDWSGNSSFRNWATAVFIWTLAGTPAFAAAWRTGYFTSFGGVQGPTTIPYSKYTHIILFQASVDSSGNIQPGYINQSIANSIVTQAHAAGVKVLLSIGDQVSGSDMLGGTSASSVDNLVTQLRNQMTLYHYDGVDVDWEHPNSTQYITFLQKLRAGLGSAYTIASAVGNWSGLDSIMASAYANVDQINVMCYDMDNGGFGIWFNDALHQQGTTQAQTCEVRMNAFTNKGVPAAKLGVGIPFYGRHWTGGYTLLGPGTIAGTSLYRDLSQSSVFASRSYDSGHVSNYISLPTTKEWYSYNGVESINDTVAWGNSRGFGGYMTYTTDYEYISTASGDARWPLSTALAAATGNTAAPPPPSSSACDVNKDNITNVADVQQCVNQSMGIATCTADINKDGICNVVDVQRVVNAALGGQCVTQ